MQNFNYNAGIIYPNKFKGGIACLATHVLNENLSKYKNIHSGVYFIENYGTIKNSDAIIITLQYENDYFNVIKIVNELKKTNPNAKFIAGGPCAIANPLPLINFFDYFVIGEIEGSDIMYDIITGQDDDLRDKYYSKEQKSGILISSDILDIFETSGLSNLELSNYDEETQAEIYYNELLSVIEKIKKENSIKRIYPKKLGLEDYPIEQLTHEEGAYGKAFLLEIGRGCPRRCKFCMAKCIYYPPRYRKLEDLKYIVDEGLKHTDADKVALIAPSVSDYKHVLELCQYIKEKDVKISPSSLRADTLTEELLEILELKSLTIAPEAGSQRMRDNIYKDVSKENILNAVDISKEFGINTVKLYYMVGFKGEKSEDINEIISLTKEIKEKVRKVDVSINPMIPKPHTPFESHAFDLSSKKKIKTIEKELKKYKVSVDYENFNSMIAQTILCRGDFEISEVLKSVKNPNELIKAVDKDIYLCEYDTEEIPWNFIQIK
ncbi:B12-binding domain-containing radical SAM protein [Methanococcus voltae]|uniref:B12-binding domain-containing radical SAM protein n=1 Tax=Methanococcus voltae TaxID=2188 RepID=UPI001FDABB60|nr:radical SAM protein [Methanococcus voltae]MBP2172075.1 radical SAM superfamily enzyme YgiQ (UPF0313 family) [Methanococcus voltae]